MPRRAADERSDAIHDDERVEPSALLGPDLVEHTGRFAAAPTTGRGRYPRAAAPSSTSASGDAPTIGEPSTRTGPPRRGDWRAPAGRRPCRAPADATSSRGRRPRTWGRRAPRARARRPACRSRPGSARRSAPGTRRRATSSCDPGGERARLGHPPRRREPLGAPLRPLVGDQQLDRRSPRPARRTPGDERHEPIAELDLEHPVDHLEDLGAGAEVHPQRGPRAVGVEALAAPLEQLDIRVAEAVDRLLRVARP